MESRFCISFNPQKPKHQFAIEKLQGFNRKKAEYIAEAIYAYEHDTNQMSASRVREIVLEVIASQNIGIKREVGECSLTAKGDPTLQEGMEKIENTPAIAEVDVTDVLDSVDESNELEDMIKANLSLFGL